MGYKLLRVTFFLYFTMNIYHDEYLSSAHEPLRAERHISYVQTVR